MCVCVCIYIYIYIDGCGLSEKRSKFVGFASRFIFAMKRRFCSKFDRIFHEIFNLRIVIILRILLAKVAIMSASLIDRGKLYFFFFP